MRCLDPPTRKAETWSLAIKSQKTTVFYKITWLDGSKTRKKTFSGEPWPPPCSRGKRIIDSNPTLSTEKIWHIEAFTRSKLLHREACTRRTLYTELGKLLFTASFYTKQEFVHSKLLPDFLHAEASTQKPLHREASTHSRLWHKEVPTQKFFLHTQCFYTKKHLHSFYTQRSFYTEKPFHREAFAQRRFYTQQTFPEKLLITHSKLLQRSF